MRNYPRIIFTYSSVYDRRYKEMWLKEGKRNYPSPKKVLNYIKKVEKLWRKDEKKVLKELSKITHLEWRAEFIPCYVVGRCRPFSMPLTVPICEKKDYFIDVLVHELIHNLFTQNKERLKKAWNYFNKKYKTKSWTIRLHVLVHAIHSHIYFKFFGEKRLKENIKIISFRPDYKKAWEIVEKEGYNDIISELVERLD